MLRPYRSDKRLYDNSPDIGARRFSDRETLGRIEAQLDTLIEADVRHAVLSAFGCGAFQNPSHEVARLYREALLARRDQFECVAFAIYYPGYGPDNEVVFRKVFEEGPSPPRSGELT